MALYNLIGRWRVMGALKLRAMFCSFNFSAYIRFFVTVWIEKNVNVSNELNFSDVYRNVNYIESLAKFT